MIGLPPRVCCFCAAPAPWWALWFDYDNRPRYTCERHGEISVPERNRLLLAGVRPAW